jgi:glycosyltransferase involved in cell wall biosynthesis
LIYSGGDGIEKNIDRLIHVLHRLHKEDNPLDLIFLGDKIGKNISLRHAIVENDLQKHVHFLDAIKPSEELMLYKQSSGVIFPSLYESFPFRLSNPLYLKTPILASKLPNIEHIFSDSITYFSPISTSSILEAVKSFIDTNPKINYSAILEKYTIENTAKQLIDIIR